MTEEPLTVACAAVINLADSSWRGRRLPASPLSSLGTDDHRREMHRIRETATVQRRQTQQRTVRKGVRPLSTREKPGRIAHLFVERATDDESTDLLRTGADLCGATFVIG